MPDNFDQQFGLWLRAACTEWGYDEPGDSYHASIKERLPLGLRTLLAQGISDGLVLTDGLRFRPKAIAPNKGPYQWFSNRNWRGGPHPNWEYYVHVAEYIRLRRVADALDLRLAFEDTAMDLALYRGDTLLVCVEAKFEADTLRQLITGVRGYEAGVDLQAPDRGNDPLRKAKYIVRSRPLYFTGVAVGARFEYRVDYSEPNAFRLSADVIPWV